MSNERIMERKPRPGPAPVDFSGTPEPEKPNAVGLTDALMDEIRAKVVRTVDGAGTISREALIYTVLSSMNISMNVKLIIEYISMIADETAKTGRIAAVACDPNGRAETTFYPKDTTFSVVPSQFLASDGTPPPVVPEREKLNYTNMKILLDTYPDWTLNLFADMCPRCGHIREGHICQKKK